MSDRHREIEYDPYRIIVNADREYLAGAADPNGRFSARAVITRLDGQPVYKNFLNYQLEEGPWFDELQDALRDAEVRARTAINDGFPDL
ncbi:hypothetical protein HDG34_007655 [Paraburkholderia sp. HC6.4b]|uniref:hypothetical protein n=1 Tax=unclassified Paraburkholderia TaxID=2615204 RepID=UPI00160E69AB|nr:MULTISPECIES: hypothetical protein [unclassified Paraburkholderia]MBB5413677.1 hypothetical protein [Paraburkholderia sp. HC6.4b]MBB5443639.1 hypothetical protein [Paraburkholderia sp. WSM4177]MBB5456092.1 hypothetical protein [Paraburkholderia sp. Kb1A]MBB5484140.1 hypothetical protein [Paraburkholderia sp. WSM4180]